MSVLLKGFKAVTICFICWFSTGAALCSPALLDSVPTDPDVRIGVLENGFTYYIRQNKEPKERAVLYLVNKVGSVLEEDHEQGLAHFLEHMNFKGTTHFPKNEMIDLLERMGVKFGADLNAYTGFEETVYQLPIPTSTPEMTAKGIEILRDWASGTLIDPHEMETERGVILEEKRQRQDVSMRIQRQLLPVLLNKAKYIDRFPIGTEEVISGASRQTLFDFFKRWYRPDLQAFIAVGDFDVDQVQEQVIQQFGKLSNPLDKVDRPVYGIKLEGANQFATILDPEYTRYTIQINNKHYRDDSSDADGLHRQLLTGMYNYMIQNRISELNKQEHPPFISASSSIGHLFQNVDAVTTVVNVKHDGHEVGFKALLTEIERAKRYGFSASELQRTKDVILNYQEKAYNEKDKQTSQGFVDDYVKHFLQGESIPSQEFLYQYYQTEVPLVTLADIQDLVDRYYVDTNQDILVMGPEKDKTSLPTQQDIALWIREVRDMELAAYQDLDVSAQLMSPLKTVSSVKSSSFDKKTGTTHFRLHNGIHVYLKTTAFKNDEINVYAFSPGGYSQYPEVDYQSAVNAVGMVTSSGVGQWDSKSLPKLLAGKIAGVSPYISERFEGFQAQSSKRNLEDMFQLMYLYGTAPRLDSLQFQGLISNYKSSLTNRYDNPQNVFADTVNAILGRYHPRRTGPSLAKVEQIDVNRSYAIYQERFRDFSDFSFIVVGSITAEELVPMLDTYLANLPVTNRKEKGTELVIPSPTGFLKKEIRANKENKATVQLVFSGRYKYSPRHNMAMNALEQILEFRMTDRLRKKESGVYSPGVSVSYSNKPSEEYRIGISFGCDPNRVDELIAAVEEEIARLQSEGPTADEVQKFIAEKKVSNQTLRASNKYWVSYLLGTYRDKASPDRQQLNDGLLERLTPANIKKNSSRFLSKQNYQQFILLPHEDIL